MALSISSLFLEEVAELVFKILLIASWLWPRLSLGMRIMISSPYTSSGELLTEIEGGKNACCYY